MFRWLLLFILMITLNYDALYAQLIRNSSSSKEIKRFLRERKADKIVFCEVHQDVYQLRNKKTKKWGMYDWFDQLIPMEYDTIIPFKQFQPFTLAKKNGAYIILKWPYDIEEIALTPITDFEAMDIVTVIDNNVTFRYFLLASHDGSWGCVSWQDLSTIIPFKYASSGDVPLASISAKTSN